MISNTCICKNCSSNEYCSIFDRCQLQLADIVARGHDLYSTDCLPLRVPDELLQHEDLARLVEDIVNARRNERPVILMMGGHPIKVGLSRFLVDLIQRRIITHLATNGAGIVHDFELALVGGTSENVAKWIKVGQFGLWRQTSRLSEIICEGAKRGEGLGRRLVG